MFRILQIRQKKNHPLVKGGFSFVVEKLSENWNSLKDYVDTWYPLIKSLEGKRLAAKQYETQYQVQAVTSRAV